MLKKWIEIKGVIDEIKFNFKTLAAVSLENRKINNKEILVIKQINLKLKAENSDLMAQLQNSKKLCDEITSKNENMFAAYKNEILTLTAKVIELEQKNKDEKNKINELQARIEKKLIANLHVAKATNETDLQKQIAQLEQENQTKSIAIEAKLMSAEF